MKKLVKVLNEKQKFDQPPIWIMRQAGRYLPEYIKIRSEVNDFLDLCYNPKLASEVTMQPIIRFDFDAAIIFSDILVIPDALGIKVNFVKNHGPKLSGFSLENDLQKLQVQGVEKFLSPVFEALSITKSKLSEDKALIGFCGAPWTLACYIIEGGGSKNFDKVREVAIKNEDLFAKLIDILVESLIVYLSHQIRAGADVIKIFDSWAGVLPPKQLQKWVINPTKKIVSELRKNHPKIPVICFPRGIGVNYEEFVESVDCQGIAIDQNLEKNWVTKNLQTNLNSTIQGNLDNFLLAFGSKDEIKREVLEILESYSDKPFIFNLGHGILPQTPIENVELVLNLIRSRS